MTCGDCYDKSRLYIPLAEHLTPPATLLVPIVPQTNSSVQKQGPGNGIWPASMSDPTASVVHHTRNKRRARARTREPSKFEADTRQNLASAPLEFSVMLTLSQSLWTSASANCLQLIKLSIQPSSVGMVAGSLGTGDTSAGALPTSSIFVSMMLQWRLCSKRRVSRVVRCEGREEMTLRSRLGPGRDRWGSKRQGENEGRCCQRRVKNNGQPKVVRGRGRSMR